MRILFLKKAFLIFALCSLHFALAWAGYHPIEVKRGGTIRGLVKYPTESPPRAMFATRGDPQCPAGVPQDQLIVKQENRGIKNVLIILQISEGKPLPATGSHLTIQGCRFVPRIQWAPKGASVALTNSDPTLHNVHALRDDNTAFSINMPPGQTVRRALLEQGLYKINDDRHLWMRTWIFAAEHPYVTVSDGQGRFELTDVPPGTYELRAWHEGWAEKGTEKTGQPLFQPMEEVLRVAVRREKVTDVLLDALEPPNNPLSRP